MTKKHQEIFIQSQTKDGKPFRPSDWVDRMCSSFASFGVDRKLRYSPYLKPEIINGTRCLAVDMRLKDTKPDAFEELMQFANENNLSVINEEGAQIEAPN